MRFPAPGTTKPATYAFALRLRALRKERRWTQLGMSKACNMDRSYISDIERGRKSCSLETLLNIAKAMGMTVSDLVKGV